MANKCQSSFSLLIEVPALGFSPTGGMLKDYTELFLPEAEDIALGLNPSITQTGHDGAHLGPQHAGSRFRRTRNLESSLAP